MPIIISNNNIYTTQASEVQRKSIASSFVAADVSLHKLNHLALKFYLLQ